MESCQVIFRCIYTARTQLQRYFFPSSVFVPLCSEITDNPYMTSVPANAFRPEQRNLDTVSMASSTPPTLNFYLGHCHIPAGHPRTTHCHTVCCSLVCQGLHSYKSGTPWHGALQPTEWFSSKTKGSLLQKWPAHSICEWPSQVFQTHGLGGNSSTLPL